MKTSPQWYVLTGGPCAGKTTTILELEKRGYPILKEAARELIDEMLAQGKSLDVIRGDPTWFQQTVLRRKVAMESLVPHETEFFFDRGVPDSIAYYRENGVAEDEELREASRLFRYKRIFLLDLIDFTPDEARNESPELAKKLHEAIEKGYRELDYDVIHVPVMPVEARVDFILRNL
jgi:predicted ATPase